MVDVGPPSPVTGLQSKVEVQDRNRKPGTCCRGGYSTRCMNLAGRGSPLNITIRIAVVRLLGLCLEGHVVQPGGSGWFPASPWYGPWCFCPRGISAPAQSNRPGLTRVSADQGVTLVIIIAWTRQKLSRLSTRRLRVLSGREPY
jgi:hypothetical protein